MYVRVGRIRTLHWLSKINWNSNLEEKVKKKNCKKFKRYHGCSNVTKRMSKSPMGIKEHTTRQHFNVSTAF